MGKLWSFIVGEVRSDTFVRILAPVSRLWNSDQVLLCTTSKRQGLSGAQVRSWDC